MTRGYPWREFGVFVGAGLVGVLLVLPYQLALLPAAPIPLPVLVLAAFVQSAFLLAIATGLGLAAGRRVGLGAPFVEASLYGGDSHAALRALQLPLAAALGVAASALVIVLELVIFRPLIPELAALGAATPARWQGLLASVYGGISEELLTRLFLVSVFAWVLSRVLRGAIVFWSAIVLVAGGVGVCPPPPPPPPLPPPPAPIPRA